MIVVSVGTQLPFDRLIRAMDALAPGLDQPVFAQLGHGRYEPRNMAWAHELDPIAFGERIAAASILVAHAGTGSVMAAQRYGKPLILYPRRAALGEHRNDHQLATCARLKGKTGVYIAMNDGELAALLKQKLEPACDLSDTTGRTEFIRRLRDGLKVWS